MSTVVMYRCDVCWDVHNLTIIQTNFDLTSINIWHNIYVGTVCNSCTHVLTLTHNLPRSGVAGGGHRHLLAGLRPARVPSHNGRSVPQHQYE